MSQKLQTDTFGRFFLPGPTEVRPALLQAMVQPMIGHRVREMEDMMARIQPGLKYIFRTDRPVYVCASSATGFMEGAVRNGVRRRVLCLVNGAFSERFYRIAKSTGLDADPLAVEWGDVNTAGALHKALRRGIYDAVTVVHSETSTGVLNPIRELVDVTRAAGDVVLLVDAVSSMGGTRIDTDAWGIDFILTGSQKCFALPPGLAFGVAQTNIVERAKTKPDRGIYFDFLEFEKNIQKNQTPNTPAVSLMYALEAQLEAIKEETLEGRCARHSAMAKRTYQWVDEMSDRGVKLKVFAPDGYRSPTVTTITVPDGVTGTRIAAEAKAKGFVIATGYGKLKDSTFRIGHMGDHTLDGLEELLDVLQTVLVK